MMRHNISIQIKHPYLHPDLITEALNWDPKIMWVVGEPRKTRIGSLMEGVYPCSYWCVSESREGSADFFGHLIEIVNFFEMRRDFIVDLVRSGGQVSLTVQLAGDTKASSRLECDGLRKLAALGLTLGVESFPHMR